MTIQDANAEKYLVDAIRVVARGEALPEGAVFLGPGIFAIAEDGVVLADDLILLIAHRAAAIIVRFQDDACRCEFDDGLRA